MQCAGFCCCAVVAVITTAYPMLQHRNICVVLIQKDDNDFIDVLHRIKVS